LLSLSKFTSYSCQQNIKKKNKKNSAGDKSKLGHENSYLKRNGRPLSTAQKKKEGGYEIKDAILRLFLSKK
jgi:hypothetical protein